MSIPKKPLPTPANPYFAVIFSSKLRAGVEGYGEMAVRMARLAEGQPGFLGADSTRDPEGNGITVSYWESLEAIRRWRAVGEHREAQARGREAWYAGYRIRIAQVFEEYGPEGFGERHETGKGEEP